MRVATLDFETDMFVYGREPKPYVCELYAPGLCEVFWGDDCVARLLAFLEAHPEPLLIYAHNGGKFDFHFLIEHLENPLRVIKSRIVSARLGKHELRDSYAILPVPLSQMQKGSIDFKLTERDVREKNKTAILEYLHKDCFYLWEYVTAFLARFGNVLTIGSAALKELRRACPFRSMGSAHDAKFRPYYKGGRVEALAPAGVYRGTWKLYDVNSMYPHAMANYAHGINGAWSARRSLPKDGRPYFAIIDATSNKCLPRTDENGALIFAHERATFYATGHGIEAGMQLGRLTVHGVQSVLASEDWRDFKPFVEPWYAEKAAQKRAGDKVHELFTKLILNSAYGKTATRPDQFKEWTINHDLADLPPPGWQIAAGLGDAELWCAPSKILERSFCDVAIGASITGAARATLMRALCSAERPIYCDTDSIICEGLGAGMSLDKYALGAWDLECEGDQFSVAGKKMYVLRHLGKVIKQASKGGLIDAAEIDRIASGGTYTHEHAAPSFGLRDRKNTGRVTFTRREFKATVDEAHAHWVN